MPHLHQEIRRRQYGQRLHRTDRLDQTRPRRGTLRTKERTPRATRNRPNDRTHRPACHPQHGCRYRYGAKWSTSANAERAGAANADPIPCFGGATASPRFLGQTEGSDRSCHTILQRALRALQPRRKAQLIAAIAQRDGYECEVCGSVADLQVDHKVPVALGGKNDLDNLHFLCRDCNAAKGTMTWAVFLADLMAEGD
jgi:hypothetical protein